MQNHKEDLINFLSNVPLFSSVTSEQLEEIASFFTPEFCKRSINPIYKSLKRPFIIQAMKNKTMEACKNGIKIKTLKSRA